MWRHATDAARQPAAGAGGRRSGRSGGGDGDEWVLEADVRPAAGAESIGAGWEEGTAARLRAAAASAAFAPRTDQIRVAVVGTLPAAAGGAEAGRVRVRVRVRVRGSEDLGPLTATAGQIAGRLCAAQREGRLRSVLPGWRIVSCGPAASKGD